MSPSFRLAHEPWIPCLLPSEEGRDLGLLELLAEAADIREVLDPSPLVTISLHRLLLAILQRALGPLDEATWVGWWEARRWPGARLADYLATWDARLDLFHSQLPFYQVSDLPPKLLAPVSRLCQDLASGTRATLFDHTLEGTAGTIAPGHAGRLLVAYQSFCLGGRIGDEQGLSTVRAGLLAHAAVFLLTGHNLFETLMLNLLPAGLLPRFGACSPALDRPAWEQDEPTRYDTREPHGYLDLLTWQSRRLKLVPQQQADGSCRVDAVAVSGGCELPRGCQSEDPMLAYRTTDCGRLGGDHAARVAWRPVPLSVGTGWWQMRAGLMSRSRRDLRPPTALLWVAELVACGVLDPGYCCNVSVLGLRAEKARIDSWAHHRQPLPVRYLQDNDLAADLERCLELAGESALALGKALGCAAPQAGSESPALRDYWDRLQPELARLVATLPGDLQHRDATLLWWAETCAQAVWQVFGRAGRHRPRDARSLRPMVRGQTLLARELYGRALRPYRRGSAP